MPPLQNLRHEQFVQHYFADPEKNAVRAYLAAGYTPKTLKDGSTSASATVSALLKTPKIKKRLEELVSRQLARMDISADRVLRELARIAFSDIGHYVGKNGCILDPGEMDDDARACVAAIETEKLFEGKGPLRKHIGYTQRLKLWDKNAALNALGKHFKLLGADAEVAGDSYNFHFYIPENNRDPVVVNGKAPLQITNGHSNGHTNGHGE